MLLIGCILPIIRRLQQISLASMTMETGVGDERSIPPCPDGPYRLPWQGLLSYNLLAIPAYTVAHILIDVNSADIIKITNFLRMSIFK